MLCPYNNFKPCPYNTFWIILSVDNCFSYPLIRCFYKLHLYYTTIFHNCKYFFKILVDMVGISPWTVLLKSRFNTVPQSSYFETTQSTYFTGRPLFIIAYMSWSSLMVTLHRLDLVRIIFSYWTKRGNLVSRVRFELTTSSFVAKRSGPTELMR